MNTLFKGEHTPVWFQSTDFSVREITGFLSDSSISGLVLLGGAIPFDFVTALMDSNYPFVRSVLE